MSTDNQPESGMGAGGTDVNRDSEENMGANRTDDATVKQGGQEASDYEYGMGSGRPAGEDDGIIPGHKSKEGGGLMKKVENIFHKDKN